ncbi:ankyrin repeat domain-containing protein [Pseudomonas sp. 5P_3.1_Bac2]|uniref:ankyrin repeat domain-containing protein n=1 Tax=Pseudomonas sp. 5P_3.1_Bac2 TaxID=2971617 RepID=UPI0021C891AE|nr:ankyrin repeat domain-containing protein [Pseudomonas sp. 5P_3.1_Bac2]MCU1716871.1 ankyrin repeat domain-containing protein [Pseudomonas sp. 5P_3.1_Bac2]
MSNATNQEQLSLLLAEYSGLPEFSGLECTGVNSASLFGDKPIHIAATRGDINEIQLILSQGADVNCKGEHGYTALHDAVEQGHREAVIYLLKHGANSEALNDDGVSPAELAKLLDESEILNLLGSTSFPRTV